MISLVNPGSSFSVVATINKVTVTFLLDTGSALTILQKDVWDQCKHPNDSLTPWNELSLVGVEGTMLTVYGSALIQWEADGKVFVQTVIVVDPLRGCSIDLVNHVLTTENGQVITLCSQNNNNRKTSVLSVKVAANVRIPSYSELELMADVSSGVQHDQVYVLEGIEMQSNRVMVARAVVTAGNCVPVRVLNPTDQDIILYKGTRIAALAEVEEPDSSVHVSTVQETEGVSPQVEAALWELVKETSLGAEEQDKLFVLLMDYADIFAMNKDQLGRTDVLQHRIYTGDAPPIRQQFRRMCQQKKQELRALLAEMLSKEIIQPSSSPWSSPVVLVRKKDGTSRFCVDYRKVNSVTRKDAYPLPRINDVLDTLAGSKLFSTLDLISGYWQVGLHQDDKEKTAFCTSEGLYEFNVMPFGLCNGPATFQRLMDLLLAGIQWNSCLVYLDDIIVLGKTLDDHLKHLAQVFQRLREANLKLQIKKCNLCKQSVQFLGHVVSSEGIAADPAKIEKVVNWPVPTNKSEVQQFLGLVSYYRRFIRDCAHVAKPLYQLTEHSKPFAWTAECGEAFSTLKKHLSTPPVLVFPDFAREFILDTDASNQGIGAVLSQIQSDGQEQVVAYASRLLSKTERRYSVTRKELLAVVVFLDNIC